MLQIQRLIYALACAVLLTGSLLAQSDRGTITGRVTDATDAAVTNANVVITNQETGIRSVTKTGETGNYVVPQLPVGRYELAIETTGFKRYVRRDIDLNVAQTLTLNVAMEVGGVEQQIEVTG